jgi:hypothetical protein
MKKLLLLLFFLLGISVSTLNARGIALGVGLVKVGGEDTKITPHLTIEGYSRLNDSIIVGGLVFNADGYDEGNYGNLYSIEGGLGIIADKKLNFYLTAGVAYQQNNGTTADASLGNLWSAGLSYRLTKRTYAEIKYRSMEFSDDINGELDDYTVTTTSFSVAFMF